MPALSSGRAERPVLFLARGASLLSPLKQSWNNPLYETPSHYHLHPLYAPKEGVGWGVCLHVSLRLRVTVVWKWRLDHKLPPLPVHWHSCESGATPSCLPHPTPARTHAYKTPTGTRRNFQSPKTTQRALRHICRHPLINSPRLNRHTSKVSKTHNYWH